MNETDIADVFAAYKAHHPRAVLDKKRRRLISDRLADGYSVQDLTDAIEGCHRSEWHMGENDRGRRYTDLSLILRDADHVEHFMDLAPAENAPVVPAIRMVQARNRRSAGG